MSDANLFPEFYRIEESQDLMADACLCDETRDLIFFSLWGRDTAVQEFLARLQLGPREGGLDRFHLVSDERVSIPITVTNVDAFKKHSTRAFERTLFGSMIHVWLFDARCVLPDKANGTALAILPKDGNSRTQRLWSLVKDTCPLPLLDHWRDTVLAILYSQNMLSAFPVSLGPVEGYRLALDIPELTRTLGSLIQSGQLTVSCEAVCPPDVACSSTNL